MGGNFKTFGTRLTFFAGKSSPRSETRGCNRKNAPMQALPVGVSSSKKKEFLGLPGGGGGDGKRMILYRSGFVNLVILRHRGKKRVNAL